MAYVNVNYDKIESAAESVDSCIEALKSYAGDADRAVYDLMLSWQGNDATLFSDKWKKVSSSGSVYSNMIKALESYSDYLTYAASKYKEAQADAVNRASNLPKY